MKSTIEQLTLNEKKALAHWYNTDSYKALEHLARLEVQGLGADALVAPTLEQVKYLQGRSSWLVDLFKLIRMIHKENNQDS